MFKKLVNTIVAQKQEARDAELYRNLIRREARIGGKLFGPVPKNRRREFFCLDEHTWIWHEEWIEQSGSTRIVTTQYSVRPDGVLKSQNGGHYQSVKPSEARHLLKAAKAYTERVNQELYNFA